MVKRAVSGVVVVLALVWVPGVHSQDRQPSPVSQEQVCVLHTSLGTMVFRLFDARAPRTVANFKRLVEQGFYDSTTFYRVVAGHVIQAGDGGENDQPTVPAELDAYPHVTGAVGLARDEDPDSGSTEFYICLERRAHLDGAYAVFGLLIEGSDVLERIGAVEVEQLWVGDDNSIAFHQPVVPVVIEKAELEWRELSPVTQPSGE